MHRTTILLPQDLRERASREAEALGISLSELIRRRLAAGEGKVVEPGVPPFFSRRPWAGEGPDNVAAEHDRYLYGR